MYALVCDDWKYIRGLKGVKRSPMLCGIYASEKEAIEVAHDVEDCGCDHYVAKVDVSISYAKQRKIQKRTKGGKKPKSR